MTETIFTSAALNAASLPPPLMRALADLADVLASGDVDALALSLETLPIASAPADQVLAMAMALGVLAQRSNDAAQQAHLLARQGQLLTDSGPFELTKSTLTRARMAAKDTAQARWLLNQAQEVAARLPQVQQQRGVKASALARELQLLGGQLARR